MLARLQRITTLTMLAAAMAWALLAHRAGHPGWAIAGAALALFGHSIVLGAEFALLSRVHGNDPVPRARPSQLVRAWWGEVIAATLVFCWRQPFFSERWPDYVPERCRGARGVLLVHGFVCNRGIWNPWIERLRAQNVPCIAVNLEPVFGSIDRYVAILEQAASELERCTGTAPLVVAHSMGGLAVRRWLAEQATPDRAHHVITIASPHHGTWLARLALTRNARQMRLNSSWLMELAARENPEQAGRFTCYYGHCDNIVFPPSTATLEHARNVHLEATAHVAMVAHPEPWADLQRRLVPERTDAAALG
jgi:pimeloyl-ACP methyl ester carboxylesterase